MNRTDTVSRSQTALYGGAVGDAMGKMTEGYWPGEIEQNYGGRIEDFMEPMQSRSLFDWSYAEFTDDTRFTLLVAESIVQNGLADEKDIMRRILERPIKGWPGWEEFQELANRGKRGSRTGNGAPMRVGPIGIIHSPSSLDELVRDVGEICKCTHNTKSALSAACAIAGAYSGALDDLDKKAILDLAIEAARLGEQRLGLEDHCPDVSRRLEWLRRILEKEDYSISQLRKMGLNPGFQAWEGSVFALALFFMNDNSGEAIVVAVNEGGDADSIASMAGGMLSAKSPETLPGRWIQTVKKENNLDIDELAGRLADLRN